MHCLIMCTIVTAQNTEILLPDGWTLEVRETHSSKKYNKKIHGKVDYKKAFQLCFLVMQNF